MKKSFSALAVLCAACAVHACNADAEGDNGASDGDQDPGGTDTGNPYDDGQNGEGTNSDFCTEQETDLDPSATTPLGFAAQSIIGLVAGEHTESLAWLDSQTAYGPESGLSEITLNITVLGPPVFVDREPRAANNAGEGPAISIDEIYSPCSDSIRLDVSIEVRTAGGALDEVVETTIEAKAGDFASGRFSIDLTEIGGSFEATPVAPRNFVLTKSSLSARLGFTEYGSVGAFSLESEFRSDDGAAIGGSTDGAVGQGGSGEIAHFPAENYCGPAAVSVTAEQIVRGLSMGQALDALNATSPSPVSYQSGAPSDLTLAFTSTEERVCAKFDEALYGDTTPGSMTLEFPGLVRLISTDGRVDGSVPLRISATNEGGRTETRAEGSLIDESPAGAAGLPAQFGIRDSVDFSAYDGGFVQLLTMADDQTNWGSLQAYGLDVADCVNNPPPPDPDGQGSPGCRGTDRIPLWGAFWGEWDQNSQ